MSYIKELKVLKEKIDKWVTCHILPKIPLWVIPNHLTFTRIILTPLVPVVYLTVSPLWSAVLFCAIALTDYFDGLLARVRNLTSRLGKFLDDKADKFLIFITVLLLIYQIHSMDGWSGEALCLAVSLVLVSTRDLMITWARNRQMISTEVLWSAKVKAGLQMVSCGILLVGEYHPLLFYSGFTLFAISTVLSLYSGWVYLAPVRLWFRDSFYETAG